MGHGGIRNDRAVKNTAAEYGGEWPLTWSALWITRGALLDLSSGEVVPGQSATAVAASPPRRAAGGRRSRGAPRGREDADFRGLQPLRRGERRKRGAAPRRAGIRLRADRPQPGWERRARPDQ